MFYAKYCTDNLITPVFCINVMNIKLGIILKKISGKFTTISMKISIYRNDIVFLIESILDIVCLLEFHILETLEKMISVCVCVRARCCVRVCLLACVRV